MLSDNLNLLEVHQHWNARLAAAAEQSAHLLFPCRLVSQADVHSFNRDAQRGRRPARPKRRSGPLSLCPHEMIFRLVVFDISVNVDHAFSLIEDVSNLPGDLDLAVGNSGP